MEWTTKKDRQFFMEHFGDQVGHFEEIMTSVYERWVEFDKLFSLDQESGTVVGTLFKVIISLISSTKLLMTGNLTLSGAAKRLAIEAIALSLLFSNINLPYLHLLWEGKFSVHKAVDLLYRHRKKFKLNEDSLRIIKWNHDFYHKYSHPTILAMGDSIRFDGSGYYIGSSFDDTKLDFYSKELTSRIGLANILENLIVGVTEHMQEWPCFAK